MVRQGDCPSIVRRAAVVNTKIIFWHWCAQWFEPCLKPDDDFRRIEDLRGKKVAVLKGTNLHLAAVIALADHGYKEKRSS